MTQLTAETSMCSLDHEIKLHQQGRIADAEGIYRQILQDDPGHPGALHLLGVIRHQKGQHEGALELIGRAVAMG